MAGAIHGPTLASDMCGVSRHVSLPLGEPGYVSPAACEPGHVSPAASPVQSSGLSVATALPSPPQAEQSDCRPPPPSSGRAGAVRNPQPHMATDIMCGTQEELDYLMIDDLMFDMI